LEIANMSGIMQAMMMLAGKWVWIWNWQPCEGGDASRIAARLRAAGCAGALVKAFDGLRWFDQGRPWREIAAELKAHGVAVGGWGYCYGNDPAAEAQRAIETAQYGQADLLVLDVEAEFKGNPRAADALCRGIRDALGPEYPIYFSSFAIARYHRTFRSRSSAAIAPGPSRRSTGTPFAGPSTNRSLGRTRTMRRSASRRSRYFRPAASTAKGSSDIRPQTRCGSSRGRRGREGRME
jgi:hypothetical protein